MAVVTSIARVVFVVTLIIFHVLPSILKPELTFAQWGAIYGLSNGLMIAALGFHILWGKRQ